MPSRPPRPDRSGYLSTDTVAAISTALGGAIAMIRVSGPGAQEALRKLAGIESFQKAEPRKAVRAMLRDASGAPLDEAVAIVFRGPASFTGEDVVELHLHGGSFGVSRVLESLLELGIRQALPGEFSFRAVRNGKMSLTEAEAVSELIGARNDQAVSLALEKMSGTQARLLTDLSEGLRQIATLAEVGIDFSDQDIDEVSLRRLKERLEAPRKSLERLRESFQRGTRVQDGIRVAFIGIPNSGKSSFFNALLGEDRSIVTEFAGTTRDVVREHLTLRGKKGAVTLRLEDTAGLRQAVDHVERIGIERSQKSAAEADLVLFVVDPTQSLEESMAEWARLGRLAKKTVGIISKRDLIGSQDCESIKRSLVAFGIGEWLEVSALSGDGIEEAAVFIADFCQSWVARGEGEVLLTRLDHHQAVSLACEDLDRASQVVELDLFAADVRQALHNLGPIVGDTLPDDILGRIFSQFCIGK